MREVVSNGSGETNPGKIGERGPLGVTEEDTIRPTQREKMGGVSGGE